MEKLKTYFWSVMITIDQFFNTLLGGDPDETISSRMGKKSRESCPVCYRICKWLNVFEADHCAKSVERDEGRRNVIK